MIEVDYVKLSFKKAYSLKSLRPEPLSDRYYFFLNTLYFGELYLNVYTNLRIQEHILTILSILFCQTS